MTTIYNINTSGGDIIGRDKSVSAGDHSTVVGGDVKDSTIIADDDNEVNKYMEYSNLIAARYSVRAYRPDPVEDEKLQAVLEAARLAPTAANRQPIQLIVLHTAGREEEIGRIYRRPWFVQAPLVIAVCAISSQAWVRESDRFNARLIDCGDCGRPSDSGGCQSRPGYLLDRGFQCGSRAQVSCNSPRKPSRSFSPRLAIRPMSRVQKFANR